MLQTNCEIRKMNNYFKNKLKDRLTYCKSWKYDIDMYLAISIYMSIYISINLYK